MIALARDWKVWAAVGIGLIVALAYAWVVSYGEARYRDGAKDQRIAWQDDFIQMQEKAAGLEQELVAVRQERDLARVERDRVRSRALTVVEEEIQNAPDVETALSAYRDFRNGLRERRAARHANARADYLSSIAPVGGAPDTE